MQRDMTIDLYTDGGARGNPGPAAIGVWIPTLDKVYGECIGTATNNDAEYQALIFGLKKIKALIGKKRARECCVQCHLDSELIVKQLRHEYKVTDERMQRYFMEVWNLMLDFRIVTFTHVPRVRNRVADRAVNDALDRCGVQQVHLV